MSLFKLYFVNRTLDRLKRIDKENVKDIRKALRAAGKPVLAAAKSLAPKRTGALENSLRIGGAGKAEKGVVRIAVVVGTKLFVGKTFYGAFQEFGHFTGKKIKVAMHLTKEDTQAAYVKASLAAGRKWIPGKHYLERAAKEKESEAQEIFAAKIKELIESK